MGRQKSTIICVDDESIVLTGLKDQLKRQFGNHYAIETVDSGAEALEVLEELYEDGESVPLIISDQIMPGMKGHELLKQVSMLYGNTVQILLTGQASLTDVTYAINEANLYRYISKPWETEDLNMTVSQALQSYDKDRKLEEQTVQLKEHNEQLEVKVKSRTKEVEDQKILIEEKNKAITDSINYALQIQEAMLPSFGKLQEKIPNSFNLFKPRDIVSGDFYWFGEFENKLIIAAADCTGHGIPGAFMSMIGMVQMQQIVNKGNFTDAADILNQLHSGIQETLNQEHNNLQDGMDIALCIIDKSANELEYAGAFNPLLIATKDKKELTIIAADRMPIGGWHEDERKKYTLNKMKIEKGASYYMYSDGFQDQFGGEKNKKFYSKKFKALLLATSSLSMSDQKKELDSTIQKWMGDDNPQVDDILVLGFSLD
jgi:serine phosphatase RsbU (regulator of sigma subunit)